MSLRLISAPSVEPITLAELKAWIHWDDIDPAGEAQAAIKMNIAISGARRFAEQLTQRAFITQTWEQALDAQDVPAAEIELLRPPVQSIASVKYYDEAGTLQTLSSSLYTLDNATFPGGWLLPAYGAEWPAMRDQANAMLIQYVAGYGNSLTAEEADLKSELLDLAAYKYQNGPEAPVPGAFIDRFLDFYRVFKV